MIFAVPGGIGAISWLQEQVKASSARLYLSNHFHDAINDFRWLAADIGARPTCIAEVVPEAPLYTGFSDVACPGIGGAWLPDGDAAYHASLQANTLAPARDTRRGAAVAKALRPSGPCEDPLSPCNLALLVLPLPVSSLKRAPLPSLPARAAGSVGPSAIHLLQGSRGCIVPSAIA